MSKRKRFYIQRACYFITTNPKNRFPFFEEDLFCNILIDVLENYLERKSFRLLAYKINPDHVHLLIQPIGSYNISQILQSVKRTASNHINQLIHYTLPEFENPYKALDWSLDLLKYRKLFLRKYNFKRADFPVFQWHKSFDDVIIRDEHHLANTIHYINKQWIKHQLPVNKFLFIANEIPKDILFFNPYRTR